MEKKKKKIRVIAVVLTVLMLLGLSATSALASDLPLADTEGSITVHKYSTASESQTPGTGMQLGAEDAAKLGTPMPNVGFTLYKVKPEINMTFETTVAYAKANADELSEKFTGPDGIVFWENLPIGYYVLSETTPPDGGYVTSPDAIITLPMGITDTGEGWNYNVHVYPKNVKTATLSKEVLEKEEFYNVNDVVSWKIDSKIIGLLSDGSDYGTYKVSDPLDTRLTFIPETDIVMATGGTVSPITLVRDVDYEIELREDNTVVWELTEDGIDKITEVGAQALSIQFDTEINATAVNSVQKDTDADIENGASVAWTDLEGDENEPTIITIAQKEKPSIALGGIIIRKIDGLNKEILLDGAEFKIATTKASAQDGNYMKVAPGNTEDIVITTGDNPCTSATEIGWAMVAALPVSIGEATTYYLVETKAPDGYVLRQNILEITLPDGIKSMTATIENQKIGNPPLPEENPTFVLPTTGGIGTSLFMMIGLSMITVAIFLLIIAARKKRDEERRNKTITG